MQEQLEPILFVLAVGSAVAILAKRVGVPYNVALVLVGALLVFMHALPKTPMDPQIILVVFMAHLGVRGGTVHGRLQAASRVPHRLAAIMEGESLFNDGTALVLVSVTTQMLSQGYFEASQAARRCEVRAQRPSSAAA